jgi:hypothetical protein
MSRFLDKARSAGRRQAIEAFEVSDDPPPYPSVSTISGWFREIMPGKTYGPEEGAIKSAYIEGYRREYQSRIRHARRTPHHRKSGGGSVVTFADVKNLGRLP